MSGSPFDLFGNEDEAVLWQQLEALFQRIDKNRVVNKPEVAGSYIETWDVIAQLTYIFGPLNWDKEVTDVELISARELDNKHTVTYRATVRLTVRTVLGTKVSEDVATGTATNQKTVGDAHDLALKTAVSDALKRAAKDLGNQFGLSLYREGSTASVVGSSMAHPNPFKEEA